LKAAQAPGHPSGNNHHRQAGFVSGGSEGSRPHRSPSARRHACRSTSAGWPCLPEWIFRPRALGLASGSAGGPTAQG
jgi:hypothetical protein